MDFVKSQFDRIQRELGGLTASQKMLTASLVAIMVMTLMWWGRYAGTAEMEPLLEQSLSAEEVSAIRTKLTASGIKSEFAAGSKLMVPADKRMEALAELSYAQLLPNEMHDAFDQIVDKMTPWDAQSRTDAMFNRAKEMTLAQVMRRWPDVSNAVVIIDPTAKRSIGKDVEPSATVTLSMRRGAAAPPNLVDAAADVVAGAQAGLSRSRVKVVVDGTTRRLRESEGPVDGDGQFELVQKHETRLEEKITKHFFYIQGLAVSVGCEINASQERSQQVSYDKDSSFEAAQQIEEETEETTAAAPAAQEPGVQPNTGANQPMSLGAGGGGEGGTTSRNRSNTTMKLLPGTRTVDRSTPAGGGKAASASVRVPRSYFVSVLKNGKLDAKEPEEKALQAFIDAELPKIRKDVMHCALLKNEANVSVETYADVMPVMLAAAPESAAASVSVMLGSHGKEIALAALAVVSLFMVSTIIRKAVPAPAMAAAGAAGASAFSQPGGPTVLNTGETLAGEVGSGDSLLDGMELDEDAARAQQMLDQVSTMVGDNPDAAAALVKRWLSRP